jgi:hypothetical protein
MHLHLAQFTWRDIKQSWLSQTILKALKSDSEWHFLVIGESTTLIFSIFTRIFDFEAVFIDYSNWPRFQTIDLYHAFYFMYGDVITIFEEVLLVFLSITFFEGDNTEVLIGDVIDVKFSGFKVEKLIVNLQILEILENVAERSDANCMQEIHSISTTNHIEIFELVSIIKICADE